MFVGIPLQPSHQLCISNLNAHIHRSKIKGMTHLSNHPLSSHASRQDHWSWSASSQINRSLYYIPQKHKAFTCRSFALPGTNQLPNIKSAVLTLSRSFNVLHGRNLLLQLFPALGAIAFAIWGLEPLMRHSRNLFFPNQNDSNWKKSSTYRVSMSYLKPLIFWGGAIFACRGFDQVSLTSETSHVVKQRVLHFIRSLSTVLAFSYCLSSLIQHMQKFFEDTNGSNSDTRNMGFQFAGKALYTSVWVAAVSLFMELLGFSTQKWLTAGGLGTVLLTLAGREIFTNFLSSIMIHATRPFVSNEWIQTNIEGYEVSGTVEEVGWWSPTIIRGEDREAIHIPNHKFTVNVVRNLTQKTHWRVKTHFAISHLDAIKISSIVADMRKVMAKNPQVEQQRLHRRIFLEYINPENQAFMILISCFIKTSHYEEYLCVKEAILLDLLRVISHHRARLATPIRTVQKMYGDVDLENAPFADTIFTHDRRPVRSPLYLIDSTSRFNGDEKTKKRASPIVNMEPLKTTVVASDKKSTNPASEGEASPSNKKFNQELSSEEPLQNNTEGKQSGKKSNKSRDNQTKGSTSVNSKGTASVACEKKKPSSDPKNESESLGGVSQATKRPNLEENIVLGVALDGSKRTLPIDEEIEAKELAPIQNKEKKGGPKTNEKPNDSQTV